MRASALACRASPMVTVGPVVLMEGDDPMVVAYRTGDESLVDLFVFVDGTADLAISKGRIFVGHRANEPALNPVNVVTTDALSAQRCNALIPGFEFGTIKPDLPAGDGPLDLLRTRCLLGSTSTTILHRPLWVL